MSTSTEYMDGLNAPAERRFYPRVTPPTPIYVAFGSNNLGVLNNVSENGFQVSTPSELPLNSVYRVSLSLNGAPKTISVTVRTIWTVGAEKRSGIQLLDLSDEDRSRIRQWVEFEMSRSEKSTGWFSPKNGDDRPAGRETDQRNTNQKKSVDRKAADREPFGWSNSSRNPMSREPVKEILYTPPDHATTERAEAPIPPSAVASVSDNATKGAPEATQPPRIILPRAGAPARTEQPAPTAPEPAFARSAPGPSPVHADQGAAGASVAGQPPAMPPAVEANATDANLPPIANPFDDPGPNSPFQQFPSVPLPIHGEFAYAAPPKKVSRSRRASSWRSHLSAKPLILWAAVLALVCFGANALVRYKISSASRRFASESGTYTASKSAGSDASAATPADDSGATAASPAPTDSPSGASNADAGSNDRAAISSQPAASGPATNSQKDSTVADAPSASSSQTSPRRESSLDTRSNRENAAYAATAPPDSDRSGGNARASQPAPAPRSWTAPAPSRSSPSVVAADDAPQSPNVSSSSEVAAQSAPLPAASQTRPTPPPTSVVQASNANTAASNSAPAPNPGASASSAPVRSQPTANTQPSGNGSNGNTTPPSRSQSPIYNANTPAQRSAIIGSINSVHSSGIFDSNDSTSTSASAANSAAPPPSRGANANVAARPAASNGYVAPSDVPQDRDVEIPAPKGFNASWVDLPGEHVVRSTAGTVHIHRLVRVPGERVPGQRWLWRGKFNVTVGDVLNRIDPSVVQASGASGSLTVMASIDKDGYVTDLKPLNGNFALLPAVSRTVRNWHYQPTYVDNKRAETQAQIEFDLRPVTASNRTARP